MNYKKIATITMAALLAISSSMPASAVTKNWRVYHAQGAPTNSGIFDSGQMMPKGGSVCEVKMTSYENLSKTTLYAYREGHKDAQNILPQKKTLLMYMLLQTRLKKSSCTWQRLPTNRPLPKGTFMR